MKYLYIHNFIYITYIYIHTCLIQDNYIVIIINKCNQVLKMRPRNLTAFA